MPPSRPASSRPQTSNSEYKQNLHKFFGQPLNGPQEDIKKNAEQFYNNSSVNIADKFINVSNPGTIHRIKKQIPIIDTVQFNQNLKKFCAAESLNNSRPCSSQSSYRFGLSRAEIGKPA